MADVDAELQTSTSSDEHGDIVIAVMGSTGTGKSSFISLLSGDTSIKIGNDLESETSDVQAIDFVDPQSGRNIKIVDTPGFDDSRAGVTDTDILKKITDFLLKQYDEKKKLNGLIFVQRISDPRFGGQSNRNLRMFRNLCGTDNFKNVIVLTTFWDRVDTEEEGLKREQQLQEKFFADLVAGGAKFMRLLERNTEFAAKVLEQIIPMPSATVRIVQEIREEGKSLEDTAAGSVRREEVDALIASHKKEMLDLQSELNAVKANNEAVRKELQAERDSLKEKLSRWETEREELRKGLSDQLSSQADTHKAELKALQDKIDQDLKIRADEEESSKRDELSKLLTDERRRAEQMERELEAERNKTEYQRAKERLKSVPAIFRPIVAPRMLIEGKLLDVVKGATK